MWAIVDSADNLYGIYTTELDGAKDVLRLGRYYNLYDLGGYKTYVKCKSYKSVDAMGVLERAIDEFRSLPRKKMRTDSPYKVSFEALTETQKKEFLDAIEDVFPDDDCDEILKSIIQEKRPHVLVYEVFQALLDGNYYDIAMLFNKWASDEFLPVIYKGSRILVPDWLVKSVELECTGKVEYDRTKVFCLSKSLPVNFQTALEGLITVLGAQKRVEENKLVIWSTVEQGLLFVFDE